MAIPRHWGCTKVAEAVPAPVNWEKEKRHHLCSLQNCMFDLQAVPADDEHAARDPLHVHLALGAPLPLSLLCNLPQQQVLPASLIFPEALELCARHTIVPWNLALGTEHPAAVWALHICYHRLTMARIINQQSRAVLEGAVEFEFPQ